MRPRTFLGSVLLAMAFAGLAPPAAGQTTVFINSGMSVPTGDYATYYGMSFNGSVTVDIAVTDHVAVGARIGYHRAGLDGNALLEELGLEGAGLAVADGAGELWMAMPTIRVFRRFGPNEVYTLAGVGFVRAGAEAFSVYSRGSSIPFPASSEDAIGAQVAAGVRFPAGPFSTFFELGYAIGFTEAQATTVVPARLGFAYTFGWVRD